MSLKSKVLRGGLYLVIREGMGMVISLGGILLLTRAIGPQQYGLYVAAYGIFYYFQNLSQLGVGAYLVRREGEEESRVYHQAFTLLLLLGVGVMLLALLGFPLLEGWLKIKGFGPISQVLFLGLPIVLLQQVPLAKLERQLDYKRVASIELANQIVYLIVALPIAFAGGGAWSPVVGWWVQQLQGVILIHWAAKYRPQIYWQPDLAGPMFRYSVTLSASSWGWQLRTLINPLIVGRFAGVEAVAFVALANRMVETLSFARTATFRISMAALAHLQGDRSRLERAVTEGIGLQVLALGPLLVIVAWLGPWVIPMLFGSRWEPAMAVYPFIALSSLSNSVFSMHSATLYVLFRNWEVTVYHLVYIALFAGAAFLLVPRFGLVGYGWAEIATLASYITLHVYLVREIGSPDYRLVGLWWGAFVIALFPYQLGWWVVLGLVAVALLPQTHQRLGNYIKTIRGGVEA
jgi:PST family polysaccharide transporter